MEVNGIIWTWQWRWLFTAVILLIALWYGRGWDYGRRHHLKHLPRQPILFYAGLLLLLLSAASPLSFLGAQLFAMR
ncbi:MAG TPA: hypothetical protein EYP41_04670, partial [Anaerolineae bacterium]|nr:hypothetical protein [Anaerolineae bacterium]